MYHCQPAPYVRLSQLTQFVFSEGRFSPGNEWARPIIRTSRRGYRCTEAMYMQPLSSDKRNGGIQQRNESGTRKDLRLDSSTSAEYTRTDVICGYESDQWYGEQFRIENHLTSKQSLIQVGHLRAFYSRYALFAQYLLIRSECRLLYYWCIGRFSRTVELYLILIS